MSCDCCSSKLSKLERAARAVRAYMSLNGSMLNYEALHPDWDEMTRKLVGATEAAEKEMNAALAALELKE